MRVDFYQLSRDPAEAALPLIARNVMKAGERLLIVSDDEQQRTRISRALWSLGEDSFLANGVAGDGHEDRQPILVSGSLEAPNGARFLAIADGRWRDGDGGPGFERTFFLFDDATVQHARDTWRQLRGRDDCEHFYWKQDGGRWVQAG